MSDQGEVEMHSSQLLNFKIVDKLVFKILLFLGFLPFSFLPSLSPFPRKHFFLKPAVSATNVQSAHSANKWNKKGIPSFQFPLHQLKRKI